MRTKNIKQYQNNRLAGHKGFSLLELLTVISVMSLLMAILLPVLAQARAAAYKSVCMNNLRQLTISTSFYVESFDSYPPAWQKGNKRWMDLIKPYVGKDSGIYACPADNVRKPLEWDADIIMSYGINTFNFSGAKYSFWYAVRRDDVINPAATILYADCDPGKYYTGGGAWSEPVANVDYRHNKGFVASFCDGSAELMTSTQKRHWDASK